jgi:outer membrane protein TolC
MHNKKRIAAVVLTLFVTAAVMAKGNNEETIPVPPPTAIPAPEPELLAQTLSLQEALDLALRYSPSLIQSQRRWQEKTRGIALTTGMPPPEFGVMFGDIPRGKINPRDGMMTEFTLSQEIMAPPKLAAMRTMAKSEAAMAGTGYEDRRVALRATVKQAYYDLLYAEKSLMIMRENQELMEHLTDVSQTNYAHGAAPLRETLRAQTEISRMSVEIQNMAVMTEAARNKLNYLLGRPANTPLSVQEEFGGTPPEYEFAALQEEAQNSPALRGMAWEVEMARNGLSMARREFWPDFKIDLGIVGTKTMGQVGNTDSMGMPTGTYSMTESTNYTWKVGLMVMLPLWFGQYDARIQAASANIEAAQAGLVEMRNMTGMELSMALSEAQSAWRLIALYRDTVIPQAESAYRAGMVDYTNGKTDFMAALDSLVTLRNAQLDFYKARVDYEKALAYLERTTGKPLRQSGAKNN